MKAFGFSLRACFVFVYLSACGVNISSELETADRLIHQGHITGAERLLLKAKRQLEAAGEMNHREQEQDAELLLTLARLHVYELNQPEQAAKEFQEYVHKYPKHAQASHAFLELADMYRYRLGNTSLAIETYRKMLKLFANKPESKRGYRELLSALIEEGNLDDAQQTLKQLQEQWANSIEAFEGAYQWAGSLRNNGKIIESIQVLTQLDSNISDSSMKALIWAELGNCYQEQGELERALSYYNASLANHPTPMLIQQKLRRVRLRVTRSKPLGANAQTIQATGGSQVGH